MKRTLLKKLVAWKQQKNRKPLILKGVRQVGKTYLLTQFGEEHFHQCHYINFEKQINLRQLFEADLDPKRIITELSFFLKTDINAQTDLLIFDEIQACPNALTSLKYFCEDLPELALCSAGSLLGLQLNEGSYPVGKVDLMHLHPMTFHEFLAGIKDHQATDLIDQYEIGQPISAVIHEHLWERLKLYFVTGGLPEIVATFAEQSQTSFATTEQIRKRQHELIQAYQADIAKHAGKVNAMHIDRTWHSIPAQLASHYDVSTTRFKFKDIIPGINRYRQLVHVIDWLEAAELAIRLPIAAAFEKPISAYTKQNLFKLMLFDVGLLGAMNDIDPKTILSYDYGTYKGYFAENFVAQQLLASGCHSLYNWQEDRSEIEFLWQNGEAIIPIEVKSGTVTRAKSLQKYQRKYSPTKSTILSAKPPSQNKEDSVFHLPLYLTDQLHRLMA